MNKKYWVLFRESYVACFSIAKLHIKRVMIIDKEFDILIKMKSFEVINSNDHWKFRKPKHLNL